MPYIHEKSFNITSNVGKTTSGYDVESGYFHVDELMALPIQTLNRKGYSTANCCAGHPFDVDILFECPKGIHAEHLIIETPCVSYIDFREKYLFSELPFGFTLESVDITVPKTRIDPALQSAVLEPAIVGVRLVKKYHKDGDYCKTIRNIFESMEQLYLWTLNLPDFKG